MNKILANFLNLITPGRRFKLDQLNLKMIIDEAFGQGVIHETEQEMLHSVIQLGDTLVRELMVPRTEMVWVESDKTLRQALSLALRSGYSRIPVIGETLDEIRGIAYIKDLAKRAHDHHSAETTEMVSQHMRPVVFVPEIKMASELLKEMQRGQIHMAIVVDEYGGTAGLITIEDIIEEIVGEIGDEYDEDHEQFEWLSENKVRVQATIHVEDLVKELDTEIDLTSYQDVDTIGGAMAKVLGRVPIPGSHFMFGVWKVTAERPIGRRRRISSMILERSEDQSEDEL
ncbi:MAG: hypothetical protein RLZ57_1040 [Actinomycetota bacterium]|jgi:CBS domain containing-hemolysin-like protein